MAVNLAQAYASPKPAAQNMPALKQVFKTIHAESCPRSYNFHMHTVHSDGQLQPEVLIEQAIEIGLKGLAITDHHSVNGYKLAQHWLDQWQQNQEELKVNYEKNHSHSSILNSEYPQAPHLWVGVEVNADLLGCEVHILGYAFDPEHPRMQPYLQGKGVQGSDYQAGYVISAIHEAGGLAVLAHPARYRISETKLIPAAAELGIDGVETYYAYNNPNPWRTSPKQTQVVEQFSATYGLLKTCGTDTHGKNLLQRL